MVKRWLLPVGLALSLVAPILAHQSVAAQASKATAKATSSTCNAFYHGGQPPRIVGRPAQGGQVFCHTFYATSYSTTLLNPVWTSYHLTKAMAVGGDNITTRRPDFSPQRGLTPAQQGHHDDFDDTDFDRGHLVPADDAPDYPKQRDTFVVSNIVPQYSRLNQVLWRYLEAAVHRLARDEGDVFIVTGATFSARPSLMTSPGRTPRIAVPDFTYKAIFVPSRNIAVGYLSTNSATPDCTVMSIADLTRRTGIDPFPALPRATKSTLPAFTLRPGDNVPLPDCD